jgi:TatA/E family protein of Tat protein translocase
MFNLGMGEITVILVLILLFVGPKKLPEMAAGLGRAIRQIRKTTADVKNEIVLDDTFRKPFEELRDAVTLAPEELKRRDQLMETVRKQAEELARAVEAVDPPPPEAVPPETSGPWPPAPPVAAPPVPPAPPIAAAPPVSPLPPVTPAPPIAPPVGTFPRSPAPAPLQPGRLGGPPRVTPPFLASERASANITQTLTEEDLMPARRGGPPPPPPSSSPPPLPGVPPAPPGIKKG